MSKAFTERHEEDIRRTLARAEAETGLHFSVYVSRAVGASRKFAREAHAALGPRAADSVLLFVDPEGRTMEIVTGATARALLDDRTCGLAAMAMTGAFSIGDLAGGICDGLNMLCEHARRSG